MIEGVVEIAGLNILINGFVLLCLCALAARILRAWPLQRRGAETEGRGRRGAWAALGLCGVLACGAAFLVVDLRRADRAAGGVLPRPYHPKGWRVVGGSLARFRHRRGISRGRSLTYVQRLQFFEETRRAEAELHLRDLAQRYLIVYPTVVIGLLWLAGLAFGGGAPWLCRALTLPHALILLSCGLEMMRLGVYTACCGD